MVRGPAVVGVPVIVAVVPVVGCVYVIVFGRPFISHVIGGVPFVVRVVVYFFPAVASLRGVFAIFGLSYMAIVVFAVVLPPRFVALIVIVVLPALVGMPDKIPVSLMLMPFGRFVAVHFMGVVPADVLNSISSYSSSTIASGSEDGTEKTGGLALIISFIFFVTGAEFVRVVTMFDIVAVILKVPASVGVPDNSPVDALKFKPLGYPDNVKVSGSVPENFIVPE